MSDRFAESGEESTVSATLSEIAVPRPVAAPQAPPYLLHFEGESSAMVELPQNGEVVIGRANDVQLRLRDHSVSRRHAKLLLTGGDARVSDLGSQNGTRVNGEQIVGTRRLTSGDIITICGVTLVFHSSLRAHTSRAVLELDMLRQRAEAELERSLRYHRPLTVLALQLRASGTQATTVAALIDRPRLTAALWGVLRGMDVVGWGGSDQLIVLVPETDSEAAPAAAERMRDAVMPVAPEVAIGFATCPSDGIDVDTLFASARAAAQAAAPEAIAAAASTFKSMTIGERRVMVADPGMTRLFALLEKLATSDLTVLVGGETGTGKELAATALHHWSTRKSKPFVALNCAAITETLVESELFGHDKGAFSGAVSVKLGLLETANGGTVFLDEIGELPLQTQAKLLRVLETRRVIRIGEVKEREIDIRVVAATNLNLTEQVKLGRFRQDLFFRLSGGTVWLPPLRDRKRDLPLLANMFLADACAKANRPVMTISDGAMQLLASHAWPGNVRELKNVVDYVVAAFGDPVLEAWHLTERLGGDPSSSGSGFPAAPSTPAPAGEGGQARFRPIEEEIRELEKTRMSAALAAANGNQTRAAELIGMPLRTFVAKLKHYDLRRDTKR